MERLRVRLLGPPQLTVGTDLVTVRTRKELALLAYLAVESRHRHRRETLVGLLWPDATEDAARNNLRVVLAALRRYLGPRAAETLVADRQVVQLVVEESAQIDVVQHRELIAASRAHPHEAIERCDECLARLADAVDAYHGPFLHGLSVPDGPAFEHWMTLQREQLHIAQLDVLDTLARASGERGDHLARAEYGRRQLAMEPWRESAHLHVITALIALGDRSGALAQFDACRRVLFDELGLEPSRELEGLVEGIRAGTALVFDPTMPRRELPTGPSSDPGAVRPGHNLPAPLTQLVGRDAELTTVRSLLDDGHRLVTLIGPGGMGKSSLALAIGWDRLDRFPGGAWWIPLAGVDPSDDETDHALVGSIAAALGQVLPGRRAPVDELVSAVGERAALVVLDNCEHLPRAGAVIRALLEGAPHLRVVATTRERLGQPGERLVRLDGLGVPPPGAREIGDYPSVQLFLERAAARSAQWATTGSEAAMVRLCRLLDGMPLAIELAAGWVGHFSIEDIAAQVQADVDFLAAQARDRPERHSSLRAVFEYSWRSLDPVAQRALARLSVLRGSFDRATALEVAEVSVRTLGELVDKSLVRNVAPGRYSTHELLRQLAAEELGALGDTTPWYARHARYFLDLAQRARPEFGRAEQEQWLDVLEAAADDLRAALAWAEARSDTELGLRLGAALWPFWQRRCRLAEGRSWLERFLAEAGADVDPAVRADALHGVGWLCHDQDDFEHAEAFFAAGLALDETLGRSDRVAWVLAHRGVMARDRGDYPLAVELLETSVAAARAADDLAGVAYALFRLGVIAREHGDVGRSREACEEALRLYRVLGDRVGEAFALLVRSDLARDEGDADALRAWGEAGLEIGRSFDHPWVIGFALNNVALAALMRGELDAAGRYADEALALFRSHGVGGGEVEMLVTKGRIELAAERFDAARATLSEGIRRGWEHGPHWLAATGVEELCSLLDDHELAVRLLAAVDAWRREMGAPIPPVRRTAVAAIVDAARAALGDAAFEEAWAEGGRWDPEELVATVTRRRIGPHLTGDRGRYLRSGR